MILLSRGVLNWDDKALKFGLGIFETLLIKNKQVYFLEDHISRLLASSEKLDIGKSFAKQAVHDLKQTCSDLKENQIIRLTLCDSGYSIESRELTYTLDNYKKGFSLEIYPYKRGENPMLRFKTTSYIENHIARENAKNSGFDDAVFLDYKSNILETSIANIIFRKNDTFFINGENAFMLSGIALKNIRGILGFELGYKLSEEMVNIEEIEAFDEAFICNSAMNMMPVKSIGNISYNVNTDLAITVNDLLEENSRYELSHDDVIEFVRAHYLSDEDIKYIFITGSSKRLGYSKQRDVDVFVFDNDTKEQNRSLVRHLGYDWDINIFSLELADKMIHENIKFLVKAITESTLIYGDEEDFENLKKVISIS
ncbi:aminotransferase class IV [Acetoanaerobium noterae]|uniref:aminotransferase class IV n=1 Tax=Acetoanaerobium noterae TaxID=745369 RepID=UPI0028AF200A|nr:aminotransferase class IV [Acetoanaerobium noterae]